MARFRRTTGTAAVLATVVALALAACGSDSAKSDGQNGGTASGDPLRIGYLSSENDPAASYPEGRIAAEAAAMYINEELGGVDGHPIELVPCIVTSAPEPSQACANEMVQEDVSAVLNIYNYSEAVEYPIFEATGLASFGGGVGGPQAAGFLSPANTTWAAGLYQLNAGTADFVIDELGAKKAALIYLDVSSFEPITSSLEKGMAAEGVTLESVGAAPATTDWIPSLQAALDTDPDVIIVYQAQAGCLGLMKAYKQLAVDIPVVAQTLCGDASVMDAAADAAEGWYFVNAGAWPSEDSDDPQVKIFFDALKAHADGGEINAGGAAPLAFSNMMTLYENVLKPLGYEASTDSAKLIKQARTVTEGTAFMGAPLFKCGTYTAIPSVCGGAGERVFQLKEGKFTAADDGDFVGTDLAAWGANG